MIDRRNLTGWILTASLLCLPWWEAGWLASITVPAVDHRGRQEAVSTDDIMAREMVFHRNMTDPTVCAGPFVGHAISVPADLSVEHLGKPPTSPKSMSFRTSHGIR